ncbi:MAG: hypothetical protein AAF227_02580, partial [Pseudomonadota bacterium]
MADSQDYETVVKAPAAEEVAHFDDDHKGLLGKVQHALVVVIEMRDLLGCRRFHNGFIVLAVCHLTPPAKVVVVALLAWTVLSRSNNFV